MLSFDFANRRPFYCSSRKSYVMRGITSVSSVLGSINGTKMPDGTNYRDVKLNTGTSAHNEIAIV